MIRNNLTFSYFSIKVLTFNYFAIRRLLKNYLTEIKYKTVLDLGCGIGIIAPLFPKKTYLGIDFDEKSIDYAKKLYPGYKFLVKNATSYKPKDKFDLVIIVGVLHHLSNKEVKQTLDLIYNFLTKKGKIIAIEAIPPIYKINFAGQFLRWLDQGHFVREMNEYKNLIGKKFKIEKQQAKVGGILDYGAFLISKK